jgi:hypothetical protein
MKASHFRYLITTALALSSLSLSSCDYAKKALGYERQDIDEFKVLNRAPLSVPPNASERPLPPPRPGAPALQETAPSKQAEQVLFDAAGKQNASSTGSSVNGSEGEKVLIESIGSGEENIRQKVDKEAEKERKVQKNDLAEKVVFWKKDQGPGKVIDPVEENKRLIKEGIGKPGVDKELSERLGQEDESVSE